MNSEAQIQALEQKITALIAGEPALFLVEIRIKPTNNIKIFIDGDQGVKVDWLVQLNRGLYKQLEEGQFFANDDFSLEVSSPGLEEPLKLHRQYLKNIGRPVEVIEKDGSRKEGKLIEANDVAVVLEETKGKGKKAEIVQHTIALENIKTTKIQITF
jgi:ribosome maturation factor RimP